MKSQHRQRIFALQLYFKPASLLAPYPRIASLFLSVSQPPPLFFASTRGWGGGASFRGCGWGGGGGVGFGAQAKGATVALSAQPPCVAGAAVALMQSDRDRCDISVPTHFHTTSHRLGVSHAPPAAPPSPAPVLSPRCRTTRRCSSEAHCCQV